MGVFLGNIFPSKFLLKKKGTSHGGVVFAQIGAWVTIFGLQSAHEKGGGRAPVGHGLGNLLDRVLATMVGPVHATITSSIAQWWNRCVISGKRCIHYH